MDFAPLILVFEYKDVSPFAIHHKTTSLQDHHLPKLYKLNSRGDRLEKY